MRYLFPFLTVLMIACGSFRGKPTSVTTVVVEADTSSSGKGNAVLESALDKTYMIIAARLNKMGLDGEQFSLKREGNRFVVELYAFSDHEPDLKRIRKVLQSHARLEFWETYDVREFLKYSHWPTIDSADTEKMSLLKRVQKSFHFDSSQVGHSPYYVSGIAGYAHARDTAQLIHCLSRLFNYPKNMVFAWGLKPLRETENTCCLYVLKGTGNDNGPVLNGNEVIAQAHAEISDGRCIVDMTMNSEGALQWKRVTRANIKKQIAIVLDNKVCTCPTVQEEIPGGRSQITGDFDELEANDLAAILSAGSMPVPVRIVQEKRTALQR